MLRGDISNTYAPYIYIHIDDLMFVVEEESREIFGFSIPFLPKVNKKRLNLDFLKLLAVLNRDGRFNVALVSLNYDESDREWLEEKLHNFAHYTRLEFHSDLQSLRYADYLYFFSSSKEVVSQLSKNNAYHISELGEKLRVKY